MENIVKYVNTLFLVYLFANPGTRSIIIMNLKILSCFLLKGIDDIFKRQEDFLEYLITGLKKNENDALLVAEEPKEKAEEPKEKVEEPKEKVEEKVEEKVVEEKVVGLKK
jgi:hypothetical protein